MKNLDKQIEQLYSDLKSTCGGMKNDYFGLLYLENEFNIPREKAINQIAFGGNDYGIDGFHYDRETKNFYIYQFKYSNSYSQFKDSLQRLIDAGLEVLFVSPNLDSNKNQLINQIRSSLINNRAIIEQVCFRFIFLGDPTEAERSQVLDKLREDMENKKYYIDEFFKNRNITFIVEYRSFSGKVGSIVDQRKTHIYDFPMKEVISYKGQSDETMHIGLIKLTSLNTIFRDMGVRFFERNIRYGLGEYEAVNRAISKSLKSILIEQKESPLVFAFNHNGITLYAEHIEQIDGCYRIIAPRLLNGAQTVTTFSKFMESNTDNPQLKQNKALLEELYVLCKIISNSSQDFVTNVTINNNRQNPVEPWNLRANDLIQLQLQDKLKEDVGIYYERQENAFQSINMEEEGITEAKAIELIKLTQTFLVSDGNIQRLANLRQVFEDDNYYAQVFNESRIKCDSRHIVLCYKVQFRLRKLINDIIEKGVNKYAYAPKARYLLWALMCQGILNDDKLEETAEEYGTNMNLPTQFTSYLSNIATTKCRHLLSELINSGNYDEKINEGNYSFLRTSQAYEFCMDHAYKKWKWVKKRLNKTI
jgi:hypothetical protein